MGEYVMANDSTIEVEEFDGVDEGICYSDTLSWTDEETESIGYVEPPSWEESEEEAEFEYFGSSRIESVQEKVSKLEKLHEEGWHRLEMRVNGEEVSAKIDGVDIDAEDIVSELEGKDEEVNFVEQGSLFHGVE